jgi:hypothetical protein
MILIDIVEWLWTHPGEVTLNAVLLLLLRKFIMAEVHKLLYFNRDEELKWTREHVEKLSGEKWNGQQNFYKRAWIRYTERFTFYSRKATLQGNQRRKTKMIATILKANLSKKLISAIVCIGVVALNNKFNLNISTDYVYGILGLSALHISLQTIIDAIKAWSLSKVSAAVTEVSTAPIGLQPTDAPPMTYDELKPIMLTVNTAMNKFNDDLRSGKMTDTTKDAINAYVAINDYLNQKGA